METNITKNDNNTKQYKIKNFLKILKVVLIIIGFIGVFFIPRIIEGLTSPETLVNKYLHKQYPSINSTVINVNVLTNYIHEESKSSYRIGAICMDGWRSNATGRGACSHHGGVSQWLLGYDYNKSREECKKEAIRIINKTKNKSIEKSWIE
ncbi:MAG: hypothetical protein WCR42_14475 [bacterium]